MKIAFLSIIFLLPLAAIAQEMPDAKDRLKAVEDRLTALEGAPAKTSLSAFNPAMGMSIDMAFKNTDGKNSFLFRAAELNIEAPIDPYLKGWAIITASNGNPAIDAEEATLETTSLPYNLTVRGGRLFADFGRLAHFHDHELPVIDRPRSLDSYIGGETRADGLEASVLFPMDTYLNATFGAYDKMGAGNARQDPAGSRSGYEFTYLSRLHAYFDLTDNHSVDLGISEAWTPKRFMSDTAGLGINTFKNTWRTLTGMDLTYRYVPVSGGVYRNIIWGTEALVNNERRFSANNLPTDRVRAFAGYSYVQFKLGLHWRPGVMVDMTEDQDTARSITKTYTGFLTYDVTEFQRLRATYARAINNVPGRLKSDTVGLQWTGILGHHVHGFRDR